MLSRSKVWRIKRRGKGKEQSPFTFVPRRSTPAIFAAEYGFTDPAAIFTARLDAPSRVAPPQREPRFPPGGASAAQDVRPSGMERAQDAGRLVKPMVEAAGYMFGLPMKQPIITVGNIGDYLTGEPPEFEVRDVFFTKPKDRR